MSWSSNAEEVNRQCEMEMRAIRERAEERDRDLQRLREACEQSEREATALQQAQRDRHDRERHERDLQEASEALQRKVNAERVYL